MAEKAGRDVGRESDARLRVLSSVMHAFADATGDLERLLQVVADRVSGAVADSCRVLLFDEQTKMVLLGADASVNEEVAEKIRTPLLAYPFPLASLPPLERVLTLHTPLCIPVVTAPAPSESYLAPYLQALAAAGVHSLLIVPLWAHGAARGVLILQRCLPGAPPFDENDVELARNLGDHAALAISNARALAETRSTSELYELVFETSPCPMVIHEVASFRILAANAAACELYGYAKDELLQLSIADLRLPGDPPDQSTQRHSEAPHDVRTARRHRRKDGSIIKIEGTSRPMTFHGLPARLAILTDVTERDRHQEELRQMQKLDAIGVLAGGIAHDFNNVLCVILSYADLIRGDLREDDPMRDDVEEIRIAAQSAADLARQLLMFSSKQVLAPRVLDLNELLRGVDRLARRIVGENVELVSILAPQLGKVRVDPGSFERVLVNLIVNARDALRDGGKITVRTADVERGGERLVSVSVTDTGVGMTEETRARIFEPFFTTKERGRGTGLGLSTVFGIVQQSGGTVDVHSEVGIGSRFTVFLPRAEEPSDGATSSADRLPPRSLRGTETILLVEDEDQVRAVARAILAQRGYVVLDARDPAEATRICTEHAQPIDLLLSDVVMPQMGGPELARRLREARPDMKVVFMSGYTDDAVVRLGVLTGSVAFVQKPFTADVLAAKVREVLDARPAS
ncbi:MAG: sensor hybrid histidine kinase [Labilithrix sp.]|nr:sensor hybrid histidine kinase [Labilithrix sp.]